MWGRGGGGEAEEKKEGINIHIYTRIYIYIYIHGCIMFAQFGQGERLFNDNNLHLTEQLGVTEVGWATLTPIDSQVAECNSYEFSGKE
jgi:hypothetical protein